MKTAKYMLTVAIGVAALLAPTTVRADSVSYNFTGTLQSAINGTTSVTGTFTVDSATGALTAYSFADGSLAYTPATSTAGIGALSATEISYGIQTPNCALDSSCGFLVLDFSYVTNFSTLTFQPNGILATSAACFATQILGSGSNCLGVIDGGTGTGSESFFGSGNVTLATATPEPSALTLLGTGLLGLMVMGLPRKRLEPLSSNKWK